MLIVVDETVDDEEEKNSTSSHSTMYVDSDEERIVANSTDEEVDSYDVFNEKTDMTKSTFKVGICFRDSTLFRQVVKKHAIIERRPITNFRNFGRKVKYVCETPCMWKIYASPMQGTITYQIKTLNKKHTCTPTFKQKQINSKWIADYYETELKMNPTWPVNAFHKKILNDLKCEASKHAVHRTKRRVIMKISGTHEERYTMV